MQFNPNSKANTHKLEQKNIQSFEDYIKDKDLSFSIKTNTGIITDVKKFAQSHLIACKHTFFDEKPRITWYSYAYYDRLMKLYKYLKNYFKDKKNEETNN